MSDEYKITRIGDGKYRIEKEDYDTGNLCLMCGERYFDRGYRGYCSEECYDEAEAERARERAERKARWEAFKEKSPEEKQHRVVEYSIKVLIVSVLVIAEIILSVLLCKKIYSSAKYPFLGGLGVFFVGGVCFLIIGSTPSLFKSWLRKEGKISEIGKSVLSVFGGIGKVILCILSYAVALVLGVVIWKSLFDSISGLGAFGALLLCCGCTTGICFLIWRRFWD